MQNFQHLNKSQKAAMKTWATLLVMVMILDLLLYNFIYVFPNAKADEDIASDATVSEPKDDPVPPKEEKTAEEPKADTKEEVKEAPKEEPKEIEASIEASTDELAPENEATAPVSTEIATPTAVEAAGENNNSQEPDVNSTFGETGEPWQSCSLGDTEKENIQKDICGDCRKISDCDEIKKCITDKIENSNNAQVENNVNAVADTGNNQQVSSDNVPTEPQSNDAGDQNGGENNNSPNSDSQTAGSTPENAPLIDTGTAIAAADVVNEVNTNITSDNYAEIVTNIQDGHVGDVNLLESFQNLLENNPATDPQSLAVENTNVADVQNNVDASANSGSNTLDGKGGTIETGDAVAAANVVNIVNTNIVGNNWVFSVVNVLGNWVGNLILPGVGLVSVPLSYGSQSLDVQNENTADIQNTATASANTGENSIDGNGAAITTGDAVSQSNVNNVVNTNIVRNNWFYLLINNNGVWNGQVIGWDPTGASANNVYTYNFATDGAAAENLNAYLSVYNKNTAIVNNNVSAVSNTGDNALDGNNGSIQTGNAQASANIFNLINTNIVGNNWMFAVVNVMGNWQGNAVFAYPDLSVDISADQAEIQPGKNFNYKVTYKNKGYAKSGDTQLKLELPEYLDYQHAAGVDNPENDGQNLRWNLAGLQPGEEKSFEVAVKIDSKVPGNVSELTSSAGIATQTKEENLDNNQDSASVKIDNATVKIQDDDAGSVIKNGLDLSRAISGTGPFHPGDLVTHTILVRNRTKGTVYDLKVSEKIIDPTGKNIGGATWSVGKVKRGQKVLIQYQVSINAEARLGTYENIASANSYNKDGYAVKGKKASISYQVVAGGAALENNAGNGGVIPIAEAVDNSGGDGAVMGATSTSGGGFNFYLLAWLLALLALIAITERKRIAALKWQKALKWGQAVRNALFSILF